VPDLTPPKIKRCRAGSRMTRKLRLLYKVALITLEDCVHSGKKVRGLRGWREGPITYPKRTVSRSLR